MASLYGAFPLDGFGTTGPKQLDDSESVPEDLLRSPPSLDPAASGLTSAPFVFGQNGTRLVSGVTPGSSSIGVPTLIDFSVAGGLSPAAQPVQHEQDGRRMGGGGEGLQRAQTADKGSMPNGLHSRPRAASESAVHLSTHFRICNLIVIFMIRMV